MAKRGYKLQEFVAHSGTVNCLNIGKKTRRLFVTGGDDEKVNLWSIGKPTALTSLCGHASSVQSVAMNSTEVLVLAGASAGAIRLWDLEESKMVRTLTGHRDNCTATEFHPFGEFFASGAMDTNVKIWDTRKKGSIHTYKGHTRGISNIKFSPDGRWVVSGGFDNVVKVWDLTAGKLLHDFKYHEGHIRSVDFHPLEFLLATGSADGTVKFWDLETFELIGSTRPEATGVRSITFHPDGRTLFCGLDDSLKVYSWEPIICLDAVGMGWSTLGDLCINDEKLMGCSYYRNTVAVWGADISLVEPYGTRTIPDKKLYSEQKHDIPESNSGKVGSQKRTDANFRTPSPDNESEDIKTIYMDTASGNPVASKRFGVYRAPSKVLQSAKSKEMNSQSSQKSTPPVVGLRSRSIGHTTNTKSFVAPNIVPRDNNDGRGSVNSRRESLASGVPLKPPHTKRQSATKFDFDRLSVPTISESIGKTEDKINMEPSFQDKVRVGDEAKETSGEKHMIVNTVADRLEKVLSLPTPSSQESCTKSVTSTEATNPVKLVNGVTVVRGRTRSLVERFEKRENVSSDEVRVPETIPPNVEPEMGKAVTVLDTHKLVSEKVVIAANDNSVIEVIMQQHDVFLSNLRSRLTKVQVLRHFWERNDVKGAIDGVRKLPDHSVQAELIGVLTDKMETLTLDLFSCLLPVLLDLLESSTERHAIISLEMLLKLVAVFGPVVRSTVSAPPFGKVDLHAEERLKWCNQCFVQLQRIQTTLPALIRRGGLVAKSAQELILVLESS